MYNAELKERFVSEFSKDESKRKVLYTMFGAIEKFEIELSKDFSQMNRQELERVLSEIVGFRSKSRYSRSSFLKAYARWCVNNHVAGSTTEIENVDFGELSLDKMRRQSVANPQQLQSYLDCIFEKESEETVDVVFRCYFWLAFIGIMNEEDALALDVSNVDFDDMAIHFQDKEYPLYREAIPSIKKCVALQSFRYVHPNYDSVSYNARVPGTKLLRTTGDDTNTKVIRVTICRKAKKRKFAVEQAGNSRTTDLSLSYTRVWLSGRFYDMLEKERAGMSVDFTYLAEEFMSGKTYNLSSGRNTLDAKVKWHAREYQRDYERWKQAHAV